MQLSRQPRSGLATVKRDFSSNNTTDAIPGPASAPTATATKRSTFSDTLRKAIQDGVASREAGTTSLSLSSLIASQKRSLSPEVAPTPKKRQLPSSWGDCEPKPARRPEISLSDEQKYVLELVMQKKNIFYTGSAVCVG
ncbi:hypothetical protein BJV74DRAFT_833989 [Russula compacta]|nr:hypothetical protein BJV74DRAFT_833989 [Russula compacta]